jgi:hypothetical protein
LIRAIDGRRCPMAKVARHQTAEKEAGRSLELIANLARLFWDDVAERITALVKSLR